MSVSFNEELELYFNDLAMMSFNQSFGFLHENRPQEAGPSKQRGNEVPAASNETGDLEGSEDDFGSPLEKFKDDICSLLQLLADQKFAHPYGTVAGSVA